MPGDKNWSRKPNWRKGSGESARKEQVGREWRRDEKPQETERTGWSRGTKLGFAGLGIVLLLAALVYFISLLHPGRKPDIILVGWEAEENLTLPCSAANRETLVRLRPEGRKQHTVSLRADAERLPPSSEVDSEAVIIYVAVAGASDGAEPFLFRQDAGLPGDGRFPVKDLLKDIEKLQTGSTRKVLLVFDVTQGEIPWAQGVLHQDFVRGLNSLEAQIREVPGLTVICSSGVDQRSWVSPEWRTTIFGHYFIEGLRGAAAASGSNSVSALDLFKYVQTRVKTWAQAQRDDLQDPILIGDEQVARQFEVARLRKGYQEQPVQAAPGRTPPDRFKERIEIAWKKHDELLRQRPTPFVYAPLQWNHYERALGRYEELLRAGSDRAESFKSNTVDPLVKQIEDKRSLELASAWTTMALPPALGFGDEAVPKDLAVLLQEVWEAPDDKRVQVWEDGLKRSSFSTSSAALVQSWKSQWLLERVGVSPLTDAAKACSLLPLLGLSGNTRPTEMHFLAMLERDRFRGKLDDSQTRSLTRAYRQALKTRRLAEQATLGWGAETTANGPPRYPFSEVVFAWIGTEIREADRLRRQGEDRLFGSSEDAWETAAVELKQAEDAYQKARAHARTVALALHAVEEAAAILPAYAHWAAAEYAQDSAERDRNRAREEMTSAIEKAADESHSLESFLGKPDAARLPEIDKRRQALEEHLQSKVKEPFTAYLTRLDARARQTNIRELEAALGVPHIDPRTRFTMLANLQETSAKLHDEHQRDKLGDKPLQQEDATTRARHLTALRGRLALALIGERALGEHAASGATEAGTAAQTFEWNLVRKQLSELAVDREWWDTAAKIGRSIGQRWSSMAKQIMTLTDQARTEPLDGARTSLERAERWSRRMEAVPSRLADGYHPADALRRLRAHDLLVGFSDRTRLDRWFAEDEKLTGEQLYYRAAGRSLLADALTMAGKGKDGDSSRAELVRKAEKALAEPSALRLVMLEPRSLAVTADETRVNLGVGLQREGWTPEGYPTVWLEAPAPAWKEVEQLRRQVEARAERVGVFTIEPVFPAADARVPGRIPAPVTLRGVYRGERFRKPIDGGLHPLPQITITNPPPPLKACVEVVATPEIQERFGISKGALAFVLDCSGSMLPGVNPGQWQQGAWKKGDSKWVRALKALDEVLRELPNDTTISVHTYGQFTGDANATPNSTIQQLRKGTPWREKDHAPLMRQVENLCPFNYTPLIRSMVQARKDVFDRSSFEGFKSLVVLTDGDDSEFRKDPQLNPNGLSKAEFLKKEFEKSGIRVYVVGFETTPDDEAGLKEIQKGLESLPLPGRVLKAGKDNLIAILKDAMRQVLEYRVEFPDGRLAPGFERNEPVRMPRQALKPRELDPSDWRLRVETTQVIRQRIGLARGDYLRLSLLAGQKSSDLRFQRALLAEDLRDRGAIPLTVEQGDNWQATVIHSAFQEQDRERTLGLLFSLESTANRTPAGAEIPAQHFIRRTRGSIRGSLGTWLELTPTGTDADKVAVNWGETYGFWGPTFRVRSAGWPVQSGEGKPAAPVVQVYWQWEGETGQERTIKRAEALRAPFELRDLPATVEQRSVIFESIELEERQLPRAHGEAAARMTCLVVRASHPPGFPIQVQPSGLEAREYTEQHRFYRQANKYVGIFGPFDKADLEQLELEVFSIERFKSKANRTRATPLPSPGADPEPERYTFEQNRNQ